MGHGVDFSQDFALGLLHLLLPFLLVADRLGIQLLALEPYLLLVMLVLLVHLRLLDVLELLLHLQPLLLLHL